MAHVGLHQVGSLRSKLGGQLLGNFGSYFGGGQQLGKALGCAVPLSGNHHKLTLLELIGNPLGRVGINRPEVWNLVQL